MGEKIRTLARGDILGCDLEIELNKAHSKNMPRDIHIQSKKFRLDMNEREYIKLALTVLKAKGQLVKMKGISNE